jgi:hypothetical protein
MININEVKQYAEFLAKKWQSGAILSPDQFNLVIPNVVRNIVRKYYGLPEQYAPGMPMPAISADETQLVRDYLSKLKPIVAMTINDQGVATLPDDYIHKSTATYLYSTTSAVNQILLSAQAPECNDCDDEGSTIQGAIPSKNITTDTPKPVRFLSDEQFDWAVASYIRKPTKEYPIAKMIADGIQFAPSNLGTVSFTYYRYPVNPVWGYTTAGGFNTYNALTSTNIELPEICAEEVVFTTLQRLGISIREPMLINWADQQRQKGT